MLQSYSINMAAVAVYDTAIPAQRTHKVATLKDTFDPSKEESYEGWFMQLSSTHDKTEDASVPSLEDYHIMGCSGDENPVSEQGGVLMHALYD